MVTSTLITPEHRELLQKLGEAVYLHKKLAEDAQKASEAVDYFIKQGALNHV